MQNLNHLTKFTQEDSDTMVMQHPALLDYQKGENFYMIRYKYSESGKLLKVHELYLIVNRLSDEFYPQGDGNVVTAINREYIVRFISSSESPAY